MTAQATLKEMFDRLQCAADHFVSKTPSERSELARATARCVARGSRAWSLEGVRLKQNGIQEQWSVVNTAADVSLAEEIATGPLVTLRLLLLTAAALDEIAQRGTPQWLTSSHVHSDGSIRVRVMPTPRIGLWDGLIFRGHCATVCCDTDFETHGRDAKSRMNAFRESWQEKARHQPRCGGTALVLGAGNVTGLGPNDAISQIFEYGRAVLLKLHPLHASLVMPLQNALSPLVDAGLLIIVAGGPEIASEAVRLSRVSHVHLTGSQHTFAQVQKVCESVSNPPSLSCELGNVSPWLIVPGCYSRKALGRQADMVAASIIHNASLNCISTKLVITCSRWPQRDLFCSILQERLRSFPPRVAWYPGSSAAWETLTGEKSPENGTLPWTLKTDLSLQLHRHWFDKEWFLPACGEIRLDAADCGDWCRRAIAFTESVAGTLAASVTVPTGLSRTDSADVESMLNALRYGVVSVNCWSALAYSFGNVPWGGFPGATPESPESGIGRVHNPLFLPGVRTSRITGPLCSSETPPWFPWHSRGAALAQGLLRLYDKGGLWNVVRMFPDVLRG